ncbi:hypothetical protein EMIT0210MI2_250036 [Priestia megaterium]
MGMRVPRKLTVPDTLLPIIELMMSTPQIMGLPAISAWIPHRDGNGILTLAFSVGCKADSSPFLGP